MNHYDTIGFTGITDNEALFDMIEQVLPHLKDIGNCAVYRDKSGAEL